MTRHTGTVKWFDVVKGYGFVTRPEGEWDVFVYAAAVLSSGCGPVQAGDRLEFDVVDHGSGPGAENILFASPGALRTGGGPAGVQPPTRAA
ncbi:MAG: cold-shock protein [Frankiales bacterium]|jgi:CspA family cold shock protein|nr:cold-shock protein [Frankiales bacterium]